MTSHESPTLRDQIREHRFASRLELANLVATCSNAEERLAEARTIIRQIAMHRVFDRFSKKQEAQLLDVLWSIANPEDAAKLPLLFAYGAKNNLPEEEHSTERKGVLSKAMTIELPEEFIDLCKRDHTTPETVLRGFIGDLSATTSMNFDRPRDDGYSSNGSDERDLAWHYYDRVGYNRAQFGE